MVRGGGVSITPIGESARYFRKLKLSGGNLLRFETTPGRDRLAELAYFTRGLTLAALSDTTARSGERAALLLGGLHADEPEISFAWVDSCDESNAGCELPSPARRFTF